MKELIKKLLSIVLAITIIVLALWLIYWLVTNLSTYVREIPKELGASLIAAITAVMVVMVGRYYERKRELDALYRDKKMEIYDEFLKKFFDLFHTNSEDSSVPKPDDLVLFFREFMRKLILWSGPESITTFLAWKNYLQKNPPDAQTIFLTEKFLLSLRTDLRHSNRGIPKGFVATILLKEGELFLQMAKKNPKITLAELAEIENMLKKDSAD
ncbi:MAG: hypothetical protein WBL28_07950 [Methylotenera sp.]